jgi:multiple antibiotic resistance protein
LSETLRFALAALSAVFVVVDPLGAIPIFATITAGDSPARRRTVARRAATATFLVLALFAAAGSAVFQLLGVTLGGFKVSGGLLLVIMSVDMMRARPSPTHATALERSESRERDDVAIVPLAMPMLAGPGAIATVMVLMSRTGGRPLRIAAVFAAILVVCLASWLLLRGAAKAERFISGTMVRVLERVMGLVLAAVGVEFIASGAAELFTRLRPG